MWLAIFHNYTSIQKVLTQSVKERSMDWYRRVRIRWCNCNPARKLPGRNTLRTQWARQCCVCLKLIESWKSTMMCVVMIEFERENILSTSSRQAGFVSYMIMLAVLSNKPCSSITIACSSLENRKRLFTRFLLLILQISQINPVNAGDRFVFLPMTQIWPYRVIASSLSSKSANVDCDGAWFSNVTLTGSPTVDESSSFLRGDHFLLAFAEPTGFSRIRLTCGTRVSSASTGADFPCFCAFWAFLGRSLIWTFTS
jgi:hypothetical protein